MGLFRKKKTEMYTAPEWILPPYIDKDVFRYCNFMSLGACSDIDKPEVKNLKCKSCGASLDPSKNKCDYCGSYWR